METSDSWIIFDGNLVSADTPVASAHSRGLMYGDGVFDTFRIYAGKIFKLAEHLERTQSGLRFLGISVPRDLRIDDLKDHLKRVLKKNDLRDRDVIVRLQVWRDGSRGYLPDSTDESHFSITVSPAPSELAPLKLVTIDRRRIPAASVPAKYKLSNGINYILASQEAKKSTGDDALMQTVDGWVSETTIANIFWRKGQQVFTPSEECDLLPGITRNLLIDIVAQHSEIQMNVGKYRIDDIMQADSVWISNSVRELLPVSAVDDQTYQVDDILFSELYEQFKTYRNDHLISV